ncbi:MAG: hypothetical protein ACHRHE_10605 [Tepidisphaerales bacterium]
MDSISLLHNAARSYCIDRIGYWHGRYAELDNAGRNTVALADGSRAYSDDAWRIFPRYRILEAILRDVERTIPGDFTSENQLRDVLSANGMTAPNPIGEDPAQPLASAAVAAERSLFAEFVRGLTPEMCVSVPQLPFRHVLGRDDGAKLWAAFETKWGRWYGGSCEGGQSREHVTLHTAAMEAPGAYEQLRRVVSLSGFTRVIELREGGHDCEIDLEGASFLYDGEEGFWTSRDLNWMVYVSHESSITFGGSWLVSEMREVLPQFDKYRYKGWDVAIY